MILTEYLQIFIYLMFFFSIIAYATLDGFDLGVGVLHLWIAKKDEERRININAIGPVWDGNTTWIVIGSGILFAGFPIVFANLSSGLYMPVMCLLFGYMLRGVAVEFRSKRTSKAWRQLWDVAFFTASALLAVMVGLLLGTIIQGLPLSLRGEYLGSVFSLFNSYSLTVSAFGLSTFAMHGSLYLVMKTEDAFHDKARRFAKRFVFVFLALWVVTTVYTFSKFPHMTQPFYQYPILWVFPVLSFSCIGGIIYAIKKHRDGLAFCFSCFSIIFLMILVVVGLFPNIVISTDPMTSSLTLYNASSSRISLIVMTIVVALGFPLSFFYGAYIYKVFRGKVKIDHMSY